jgi:chemotaxis protein CheD
MMQNVRPVAMGHMIVTNASNDVLVAYGLGSCVALCVYDPVIRVGGMLHALLPAQPGANSVDRTPTKFVDPGALMLIDELIDRGCRRSRLAVYLCGGAQMVNIPDEASLNIGERNIKAAEQILRVEKLRIKARATGGGNGRTVRLYMATGQVTVRSLGQSEQVLGVRTRQVV